jgi:GNAT superfamily N-acetyltransferase
MPASKAEKAGRQFDMNGSSAVRVRPLTSADRDPWARLWTGYLEFYKTTLPDAVYDSSFKALTDPSVTDYAGYLAEVDGSPVGLVHIIYHRHGWKLEPVCYLQDLYADPGVRGKGIGRALIEHVYHVADAAGAPTVYWLTHETNTEARKLYDRIGRNTSFIKYDRGH